MGVTLERVQNKFACIIGELCSEPVVLSKFAIWLDLRLAEYKAKGAISLDCSGENPDPVWLKGHEKPEVSDKRTFGDPEPYSYEHASNRPPENVPNSVAHGGIDVEPVYDSMPATERLSPDVVVVKEETESESAEIYPISLHHASARHSLPGKRQAGQSGLEMCDSALRPSLPKGGRIATEINSISEEEPTNQSLISIIRDTKDDDSVSNASNFNFNSSVGSDSDMQVELVSVPSGGDNSISFSSQLSSFGATSHFNSPPLDSPSRLQPMMSFQSPHNDLTFSSPTSEDCQQQVPVCALCGKTFTTKRSLHRHQLVHQLNPPRFTCPHCHMEYTRKEHVRNHIKKAHRLEN